MENLKLNTITPSYNEIEIFSKEYNIIPICKEIYADIITPITLLRKISQISQKYYLFESVVGGEKRVRYSFLGLNPIARAICKGGCVTIEDEDKEKIYGLQFHPESILTPKGEVILKNFIEIGGKNDTAIN